MVSKKEKYLAAAQKFIERGQSDKALAEYAKVVQEDSKDTRTWLKMAELHAKRGANAEASEIYLRTGDLYVEQGFAQKALAVYKNVLKLSPATVAAHLKVAALFNQLGLVSDALQQFELAATALQRAGKPADAVAALRHAVEIQPENVVLRVKLAEGASHAGLVDEAVREFATAAEQLKAQGRGDESLRVLERLLFHQPDNFTKARELAEAYIAKGTPRLALPKLQACLNGDPRDPHTLSLLAKALEQLGQVAKAVSVLKELVRLCEELGRATERDAAVLRGLTLEPSDGELQAMAARHQLRAAAGPTAAEVTPPPRLAFDPAASQQREDAGSFELSGLRGPGSLPAPDQSGRVLAPLGLAESGRRDWSGISVGTGTAPEVSRILAEAEVFVKYGLLERAADHLPRIFELEPEHRDGREKLIGVLQRLGRHEAAARHADILERQLGQTPPGTAAASAQPPELSVSLNPEVVGPEVLFNALPLEGPNRSLAIDADDTSDMDAADPAADVMTPPPEVWDSGIALDVVSTDFDAEVSTGDVVAAADSSDGHQVQTGVDVMVTSSPVDLHQEVEFSIDEADEESTDELGRRDGGDGGDSGDSAAGQGDNTPPLVRTPMVIASSPRSFSAGDYPQAQMPGQLQQVQQADQAEQEEEDPASAFAEEVATVAGDPEGLIAAFAAFEEEELSAELEQVSFFLDQSMTDEARSLLHDLETRFPGDARVAAALRELQAREKEGSYRTDSAATSRLAVSATLGSTVIERPATSAQSTGTPTPRAVMSGDEKSDSATHADLAIAYKGMGLLDAAIAELKLLTQDETQEVFALTTMGECFEAKSSFTEAIIRYKRALNCEQITREETLLLYFLLGGAFEHLGDVSEALYFYEKVLKRDPKFRDVDLKVAELRPRLVKRAR